MSQIFPRSANTLSRVSIVGAVLLIGLLLGLVYELGTSPWVTRQYVAREQPIQFSHERHVAGNGIDCRYCHTSVEQSRFAGIPPTKTCMNCHSQIFSNAPFLEPVRASFNSNTPLKWTRVHDLPRAGRPHAADVSEQHAADGVVPGLPPEPGAQRQAPVGGVLG